MTDQTNLALSLTQILQGKYPPSPAVTIEHEGDGALIEQDWPKAITVYEQCGGLHADEKRGWCLVQSERWEEGVALLALHRDGLSSAGLTALAIALAGGWSTRYRLDESARSVFDELLSEALADETPDYMAYAALFWFRSHRQYDVELLEHARKGVSLYSNSPYLRLQMAECSWKQQGDQTEAYSILKAGLDATSTTEYLWACALSASSLARWDDALAYLDRAVKMTIADGDRSRQTAQQLRLKQAEVLVNAGRDQAAVAIYQELAALDISTGRYVALAALRALLAMACRGGDFRQTRDALESWLKEAIPSLQRCSANDLIEGECEPIYFFDGEMGSFDTAESLAEHHERLLEVAEANERGLVRFLFAERERYISDAYDRQAFAESMLEAAKETDSPVILAALATAYAIKKMPNWQLAGSTWARYELHRLSTGSLDFGIEPLDADAPPSEAGIEAYAKGMRQVFKEAAPSQHLSEIFSSLREVLRKAKMYRAFRDLADLVAKGSENSEKIFDAALGAHWCKDHDRAIALYWDVLSRNAEHYSALHNLLLLYRDPKYAGDVEQIAKLVETFPADDSEKNGKLLQVLADAREACRDPNDVARRAVQVELRQYPALITALPKAAKVPLQDAVTLMTLMRICDPADGSLMLQPFGQSGQLFSPTTVHRRGLFRLMQSGLIEIAGDTPLTAFDVKDDRVRGYYFDRMWWRISPATISLIQSIQELAAKSVWPQAWCNAARVLAAAIAEEECVQYVMHVAEDRGWPGPDDDAKVHALAKSLVQSVSVSQAFYLIYLGAMAASDHKQRYPINNQQASNIIVLRAGQRLDAWMQEGRQLKSYSRNKHVPRSVIAQVFHDEFLGVGERAFSERVEDLPYPRARKTSART